MPKVWTNQRNTFVNFRASSWGGNFDQFSGVFSKTDVTQSRNVIESSATFHFIEKCLFYNSLWLRQLLDWFVDMQELGSYYCRNLLVTIAYFTICQPPKLFWKCWKLNISLVDTLFYMYHAVGRRKIYCLEIENYFYNTIVVFWNHRS
jgi:hypothetical protein